MSETSVKRVRLGFLIPARNVTCETEFTAFAPKGVTCHFSRLARAQSELTSESIVGMMAAAEEASTLLSGIDVAVVGAACTSGSFLDGRDAGEVLAEKVSTGAGGVPAFTTTHAVEAALARLGVRTLFMLTPYPDDITEFEKSHFEERGFVFSGTDTFGCERSEEIRALTSEDVLHRLKRDAGAIAAADAVFVSCTNLATMDRLEEMSRVTDKPVISSNSATFWYALDTALAHGAYDYLIFA